MNGRAILLLSGACLALAACQHPENYRWSGDADHMSDIGSLPPDFEWNMPSVSVYSYATPGKDAPAGLSLRDLSDRAQEAYILNLLKKGAKQDEIRAALAKPLTAKSASDGPIVEGKYDRTVVATVTKGLDAGPADRLMSAWIVIQPLNFKFTGYTVIATDNQTLNIEHVQNVTTATGQLQASVAPPADSKPSLGLTGSLSNQYTTSADINQQYVKLGADILPHILRIYRESERNLDVAGNTLINLSVQVEPERWNGRPAPNASTMPVISHRVTKLVISKDGKLLAPSAVTLDVTLDKAPPHCDLVAKVSLVYQLRHVTRGEASYVEGEQHVTIEKHATTPVRQVIVPADEVHPARWMIFAGADTTPLSAVDSFQRTQPLTFTDYEQARAFATWLTANRKWLASKTEPPLGKTGVSLTSGIDGKAIGGTHFEARLEKDPGEIAAICRGMEGTHPL